MYILPTYLTLLLYDFTIDNGRKLQMTFKADSHGVLIRSRALLDLRGRPISKQSEILRFARWTTPCELAFLLIINFSSILISSIYLFFSRHNYSN